MIKQKLFFAIFLTLTLTKGYSQEPVNEYDKNGERHGLWTKNFHKTDQKRYEGVFSHGKEIDSFKYYRLSNGKSVLSAVKVFNAKDSLADVTFFASNKKIISEGRMNGKKFIGEWIYYHKNSNAKMIIEHYNDVGQLEGARQTFYKNGVTAEIANYKDGELNGEAKWFSENNILLRLANYKNGVLNGKTINYDADGNVTSEGDYKADKKEGIWKYYEAGKIKKEIDHTNQVIIKKYE